MEKSPPHLGREIGLEEYNQMSEEDKFCYVFVAVAALTHLEAAAKEAGTILERSRSIFGVHNLKKNFKKAKDIYANQP